MKMIRDKQIIHQKGQGLMEVIVAIGVIVAGILATVTLIISSVRAGRVAADRLTAMNLAREGIEIVRNMRDSNWMTPSEVWNEGFNDGLPWSGEDAVPVISSVVDLPITLDFVPSDFNSTSSCGAGCTFRYSLIYQHSDGRFLQGDRINWASLGDPTGFSRMIFLNPICRDDTNDAELISTSQPNTSVNDCSDDTPFTSEVGMQVRVEVRWPQYTGNYHSVILEERLYDWR